MARAANGQSGVGSGFDAEAICRGSEVLLALYSVSSHEWVAVGTATIDEGDDLDVIVRNLASNPGSFGEDLVWADRDPETYGDLAGRFDELEKQYRAQEVQS